MKHCFGSEALMNWRRGESLGRNPRNGEKVIIKPKRVPFFRAGKRLRDAVNEKKLNKDSLFKGEDR